MTLNILAPSLFYSHSKLEANFKIKISAKIKSNAVQEPVSNIQSKRIGITWTM